MALRQSPWKRHTSDSQRSADATVLSKDCSSFSVRPSDGRRQSSQGLGAKCGKLHPLPSTPCAHTHVHARTRTFTHAHADNNRTSLYDEPLYTAD